MRSILLFYMLFWMLAGQMPLVAQSAHNQLRDGDRQYQKKEYKKAEELYRKAIEKEPDNPKANYNLGNSVYMQGRFEQAAEYFTRAIGQAKTKEDKADAYYNLGNAQYKQQKWQEAVTAYQNSLLQRPGDPDVKRNLQMAKKKLEEDKKKEKKDKNEENKDKDKDQQKDPNKDNKDNKDQQKDPNKDQEKQDKQQQQDQQNQQKNQPQQDQQQPKEGKMSKQEAIRLLETAIEQEDQKNAKKYRQQPRSRAKTDKDW